ncbi:hypothetical protein [Brevibacterium zhoupengii]|uniref:hypothetical protein n=1 Tax=Brevibacterium zhoupengii TaxID=2898795 RepID=UPI001F089FE3|nr:hypothetical protein [Brevibacterium zhoupengii]
MNQQASAGPGWTARILFWFALAFGSVSEIWMLPMLIRGGELEPSVLFSSLTAGVAVIELVLGLVALLIVRSSPVKMRLIGMGVLLAISIYAFALPYLLPIIVNQMVESLGGSGGGGGFGILQLAMIGQSIIWAFHVGVLMAGWLIAWNLARNRVWWTHLIAAAYALVMGLIVSFLGWQLNSFGGSYITSTVLTQLVSLAAALGGFVVLHLVGETPGAVPERRRDHPTSNEPWSHG